MFVHYQLVLERLHISCQHAEANEREVESLATNTVCAADRSRTRQTYSPAPHRQPTASQKAIDTTVAVRSAHQCCFRSSIDSTEEDPLAHSTHSCNSRQALGLLENRLPNAPVRQPTEPGGKCWSALYIHNLKTDRCPRMRRPTPERVSPQDCRTAGPPAKSGRNTGWTACQPQDHALSLTAPDFHQAAMQAASSSQWWRWVASGAGSVPSCSRAPRTSNPHTGCGGAAHTA
jgi:hypothetical protein